MTFDIRIGCEYYYNSYIYNYRETEQILVFKTYNLTARLNMMYMDIVKYFNHLFFSEYKRLLIKNSLKDPKIAFN